MDHFDKNDYIRRLNDSWVENYPAVYRLFMNQNAVNESSETGDDLEQANITFKTVETLGEVSAAPISEQSTEMNRFKVGFATKNYLKYASGISWKKKGLKPTYANFNSISNQALNRILAQEDNEFITGKNGYGATVNNGLFLSQDPDYVTETAQASSYVGTLSSLNIEFQNQLDRINKVTSGPKYIFAWGNVADSLKEFPTEQSLSIKRDILSNTLDGATFIRPLADFTAGASAAEKGLGGYLIVTPSAVRLHYTFTTKIINLGYNEENLHIYLNIGYGSKGLEVLNKMGIYKKVYTA